jgi:NADH:ubiquinone oxidoreductase subunit 6 (subunit J)
MVSTSSGIVAIAVLAVAVVLIFGLVNMLRQGEGNRSQMLMRWRVGLQFLAILAIVGALYFRAH